MLESPTTGVFLKFCKTFGKMFFAEHLATQATASAVKFKRTEAVVQHKRCSEKCYLNKVAKNTSWLLLLKEESPLKISM